MTLPNTLLIEITGFDAEGDALGQPVDPALREHDMVIFVVGHEAPEVGQHVLAKIKPIGDNQFIAKVLHKEKVADPELLGVFRHSSDENYSIQAYDGDRSTIYSVPASNVEKHRLSNGMVVRFRPIPDQRRLRGKLTIMPVQVLGVIANAEEGSESLIALFNNDIPQHFPAEVEAAAAALEKKLAAKDIKDREDLRALPIVTIDGADAKDFDDAVWAEEWRGGGYHIVVAIADVAHYVIEGGEIDKEAFNRGNSVYLPDKVVPMLPEVLCNDYCSLKPHEDRPVLTVHLYVDAEGRLRKYEFTRAVIHSHARLTYEQVQAAIDGKHDVVTESLWASTIKPLYDAYKILDKARAARGALELEMSEKKIVFNADGSPQDIQTRERFDAHKLIEEMMILANVAAAQALEEKKQPALYRVHPVPSAEKIAGLQGVLQSYGLKFSFKGKEPTPADYQPLLTRIQNLDAQDVLMMSVLRSQQQASYDPVNMGHFGLALTHYTHFTSPIRRYSDLIVHRALIASQKLPGQGALRINEKGKLTEIAEHINVTERRAQGAEYEAKDRFTARLYSAKVDQEFLGQVISVLKFGMFVRFDEGKAEGLLPMSALFDDFYEFDQTTQSLKGRRTNKTYKVGDKIKIVLTEADKTAARLTLSLPGYKDAPQRPSYGRKDSFERGRREGGDGERREFKPRREGGFRDRKEGGFKGKRDGFRPRRDEGRDGPARDGERREFKPRDDGDFKPREDREFKPRGEFKPRREGEFKPRSEFKPRGEGYRGNREGGDRPRRDGGRGGPARDGERREFKPRGDFQPRGEGGYRGNREGGDRPRRDGEFKPRSEFKPRGEGGNRPRREGEFKPRSEFKPRGEGGYKPREGGSDRPRRDGEGFKPRGEGGFKPRSGGFKGKPRRRD